MAEKTYRDIDVGTISIFNVPLEYGPRVINRWCWTRVDENGTQVDGTGAVANAEMDGTRDELFRELKRRFPEDEING